MCLFIKPLPRMRRWVILPLGCPSQNVSVQYFTASIIPCLDGEHQALCKLCGNAGEDKERHGIPGTLERRWQVKSSQG